MEALIEFVMSKAIACQIDDRGDYYLVRVPNPQDFDEEELSQIASKPVKLEVLEYALG